LKFIERYSDLNHHEEFGTENERSIIKCCGSTPCCVCGEYSYFVDGRLLVCLCSEECQKKIWEDLDEKGNKKQL